MVLDSSQHVQDGWECRPRDHAVRSNTAKAPPAAPGPNPEMRSARSTAAQGRQMKLRLAPVLEWLPQALLFGAALLPFPSLGT